MQKRKERHSLLCIHCGEDNPQNFYRRQKICCKKCHNLQDTEAKRQKRQIAVDILGGKCSSCGYNKCIAALDIHHINPTKKSSTFTSMNGWSIKRIEKELENCILLCRNCHAELHWNEHPHSLMEQASVSETEE